MTLLHNFPQKDLKKINLFTSDRTLIIDSTPRQTNKINNQQQQQQTKPIPPSQFQHGELINSWGLLTRK